MSTELNYDGLVKAYYENLHTTLRNFRPGPEFLESWVHDEDHNRSIVGIFEAAEGGGVEDLSLQVGPQLADALDKEWLKENLSDFGDVSIQEAATAGMKVNLHFATKKTIDNVHPAYQRELAHIAHNVRHEGTLKARGDELLVETHYEGITLSLLLDSHDTVLEAKHNGARGAYRPLLDALCEVMPGQPLQECAEHAVIQLEAKLRNVNVPPPVPGLITPNNADPIFKVPLTLVRDAFRKSLGLRSKDREWNNFEKPVTAGWATLSVEERKQKVREALLEIFREFHLEYPKIEVLDVKHDSRLFLSAHDYSNAKGFGHDLLVMERELKRRLEPRLEVTLESLEDRNKREARTHRDPLPTT